MLQLIDSLYPFLLADFVCNAVNHRVVHYESEPFTDLPEGVVIEHIGSGILFFITITELVIETPYLVPGPKLKVDFSEMSKTPDFHSKSLNW